MTDKSKSRGYEVGYGKPPVSGRFRKGSSGNPSGRPKMLPTKVDPASVLEAIDSEEVIVIDNGKRRRMLKARVYFRQLMTRAIKGDLKAARLVSAWPPSTSRRRCSPLDEWSASVSLKHKVGMVGIGKNTFDILDEPT